MNKDNGRGGGLGHEQGVEKEQERKKDKLHMMNLTSLPGTVR